MATVVLSAEKVLEAVEKATARLEPPTNTIKGGWKRDQQTLLDIATAATDATAISSADGRVGLDHDELEVLGPDLK